MKLLIVSDKKRKINLRVLSVHHSQSIALKIVKFFWKKKFCVLVYEDITIFSCNYFVSPANTSVKES